MNAAERREDEPVDASRWHDIRQRCERRQGAECRYPWCNCTYPGTAPALVSQMEREVGEVELTTAEDGLRTAGAVNHGRHQ